MKKTIEQRFLEFHYDNPHVYRELVKLCNIAHRNDSKKVGIGMLFEVLRWNHGVVTNGEKFKMCNDYRSRYARLIMEHNEHLRGIFNVRDLKSK